MAFIDEQVEESVEGRTNIFVIMGAIVHAGFFIFLRFFSANVTIGFIPVFLKSAFEELKQQPKLTLITSLGFFVVAILLLFLGAFLIYRRYIATSEFPFTPFFILLAGLGLIVALFFYNPKAFNIFIISGVIAPIFEEFLALGLALFIARLFIKDENPTFEQIFSSPAFWIVGFSLSGFFALLHVGVYGLTFISALVGAFLFRATSLIVYALTRSVFTTQISHSVFNIFLLSIASGAITVAPLVVTGV